jgi:hypothetical protein
MVIWNVVSPSEPESAPVHVSPRPQASAAFAAGATVGTATRANPSDAIAATMRRDMVIFTVILFS